MAPLLAVSPPLSPPLPASASATKFEEGASMEDERGSRAPRSPPRTLSPSTSVLSPSIRPRSPTRRALSPTRRAVASPPTFSPTNGNSKRVSSAKTTTTSAATTRTATSAFPSMVAPPPLTPAAASIHSQRSSNTTTSTSASSSSRRRSSRNSSRGSLPSTSIMAAVRGSMKDMSDDYSMNQSSLWRASVHSRRRSSRADHQSIDLTNATRASSIASVRSHTSASHTSTSLSSSIGWGSYSEDHSSVSSVGRASVKFCAGNFVAQRRADESLEAHYQVGDLLGEGGYGEVYACRHKESGVERAVKVIAKEELQDNQKVLQEFEMLKEIDHPNVLKVYELFECPNCYYIISDIVKGGELYDELERLGSFREDETQMLVSVVLSALNYCHQRGLIHRDLKPENILLEDSRDYSHLKLIDFGLAKRVDISGENGPTRIQTLAEVEGSRYYLSPQVIRGEYGCKSDVWACGVVCYIMLCGFAPFDGETDKDVHREILNHNYDFSWDEWDDISDLAKDFIAYLLTYDEDERPTAEEALQHPWLQQHRKNLLETDNPMRHSIKESIRDLQNFQSADSKLKQATCAIIASQLLSKEETGEIERMFRNLDIKGNGNLSREDLKESYKELFGLQLTDEEMNHLFKEVNFSCSGRIEYSEFVIAHLLARNAISDNTLLAAFRFFDKEDKGYISHGNLKDVLNLDDTMDSYVTKKIIKPVDADGDGQIDFEEFKNMMVTRNSTTRRIALRSSANRSSVVSSDSLGFHGSIIAELEEDWSESENHTSNWEGSETAIGNDLREDVERPSLTETSLEEGYYYLDEENC